MSDLNVNFDALVAAAIETQTVDLTETGTSGGGGLMPAGQAYARMYKYIEYGQQPQEYNGKAKAAADEFKIGFQLYGGPEGCYNDRTIDTFGLAVSNNAKAGAKKAFDKLNWKGDIKHPAQAMGRAFMVTIIVKKNAEGKESNRLDLNGIFPALNPADGKEVQLPELDSAAREFFFFAAPTPETWGALYQEGTWDNGDSKNRDQEKILKALNFPGSKLEQMISGVVLPDLTPDPVTPVVAAAVVAEVVVAPVIEKAVEAASVAPVMPTMPVMPTL